MARKSNKIMQAVDVSTDQIDNIIDDINQPANVPDSPTEIKEVDYEAAFDEMNQKLEEANRMYEALLEEKEALESANEKLQDEIEVLKFNGGQSSDDINVEILNKTIRELNIQNNFLQVENEHLKGRIDDLMKALKGQGRLGNPSTFNFNGSESWN